MFTLIVLAAVANSVLTAPTGFGQVACPILFDGRVPLLETAADFDKNSSRYDHQFVHGDSESTGILLL